MRPLDHTTVELAAETAPSWLADLRQNGFEYFEKLSMPTGAEEEWRYVDLDFDIARVRSAGRCRRPNGGDSDLSALTDYAGIARLVDGFVVDVFCNTPGVTLANLAGHVDDDSLLEQSLGRAIKPDIDISRLLTRRSPPTALSCMSVVVLPSIGRSSSTCR